MDAPGFPPFGPPPQPPLPSEEPRDDHWRPPTAVGYAKVKRQDRRRDAILLALLLGAVLAAIWNPLLGFALLLGAMVAEHFSVRYVCSVCDDAVHKESRRCEMCGALLKRRWNATKLGVAIAVSLLAVVLIVTAFYRPNHPVFGGSSGVDRVRSAPAK